jgi:DNA-binding beta-propeller fold protein YncE
MYDGQIDVHGLGFSCDGQYLNVIYVTTNAVHVIDTATNAVVHTI